MRARTSRARRLRAWGAATALATGVVAVAGAGSAQATEPSVSAGAGGLRVAGDPLVHTFDLEVPGDSIAGEWVVRAGTSLPYDGTLLAHGAAGSALAHALVVEYGRVSAAGAVAEWRHAGTLAEARSYGDALGVDPVTDPQAETRIPVRVSLPDPERVRSILGPGEVAVVEAAFVVTHLDADELPGGVEHAPPSGTGSADVGGPAAVLARTGSGSPALGLVAWLLGAGALLARAARRAPS